MASEELGKHRSGCFGWGLSFVGIVAATLPVYFAAVWSYASATFASASGDEAGWLFFLFPLLLLPPLLPWLGIAVPIALALSFRGFAPRLLLLLGAAFVSYYVAINSLARPQGAGEYSDAVAISPVGNIPPTVFVLAIWAASLIAAFIADKTRANIKLPTRQN